MNLIFIFGAPAVGKMTVGQELSKLTAYTVFHNHMTIDPVKEILGYVSWNVVGKWREAIFEELAGSQEKGGLIFTYAFAFNEKSEWDYVERVSELFRSKGGMVYYVELHAPQEIRLQRNPTENRLKHKSSKRDIAASNDNLKHYDEKYRCVSNDGEVPFENYIKIDNTNLPPSTVAKMINERFDFGVA